MRIGRGPASSPAMRWHVAPMWTRDGRSSHGAVNGIMSMRPGGGGTCVAVRRIVCVCVRACLYVCMCVCVQFDSLMRWL